MPVPTPDPSPGGEIVLYQMEGNTRIDVRLDQGTVWLSQRLMAELYDKDVRTINEHLLNIYDEGELKPEATIRKFRIVQNEGSREVARMVDFYNLEAILAVGYRVRSQRGTQFRQWATAQLSEFLVKGLTHMLGQLRCVEGGEVNPITPPLHFSKNKQRRTKTRPASDLLSKILSLLKVPPSGPAASPEPAESPAVRPCRRP